MQCSGTEALRFTVSGRAGALVALVAAVAACGGGGGGSPAPTPSPPSPPSYTGARISAAQLPAACAAASCIPFISLDVDASGEASLFWSEVVPGGTPRLRAAHQAAAGTALLGSAEIASNYNTATVAPVFQARPIGSKRFVLWQSDQPAPSAPGNINGDPLHARIVDFNGATPTATGLTTVPSSLSITIAGVYPFPGLLRDNADALFAVANAPAAGTVVPLGGGASLTVVPTPASPLANTEVWTLAEYPESIASRAMWALRGSPTAGAPSAVVLADVTLPDATVLPTTTLSQQPVIVNGGVTTCERLPAMKVRASVGAVTQQVVAWTQLNGAASGCDLYVNGTKVNGARSVTQYDVSVSGNEIVAVWEEFDITGSNLYWSRRPLTPTAGAWSTPAAVAPGFSAAGDIQTVSAVTSGPNATLLVVWQNLQPQGGGAFTGDGSWRASKYVGGSWSTVRFAEPENLRAIAINGSGQAAVLVTRPSCGASSCEDLALYRY